MPETLQQNQVYRFDQIAAQVKDKIDPAVAGVDRYVGLEHLDPESLKIRRWGIPSDVESSKIIFKSNDIIFGKRRAYQRKLAVADFDGICSAHAMVLRPKTDVILEEFLPFFMQSDIFMDRAVKISVGGLSPTINWAALAKEEFALPLLEEQRRIAEVLLGMERAFEEHLKVSESSTQVHVSTLDNFFGKEFEARGASAPTSSQGLSWPIKELGKLAEIKFSNVDKKTDPAEQKVELCNYMDVYSNDRITSKIEFMSATASPKEIEAFHIREGDVLITKDSEDPLDIGVPSLVADSLENVICGYHLAIVRPYRDQLDSQFLAHYLHSTRAKCYMYQMAQGVTRFGLTNPAIRSFPIPFPPIEEQKKLAALFESCRIASSISQQRAAVIQTEKFRLLNRELGGLGQ